MNPGVVEEAGKAAGTFMTVMKDQPLALALALMNLCLMALFFYVAQWAGTNRTREFDAIMEAQKETQKLLYNCVPLQRGELVPLPMPRPKEGG